MNKNDVHNKYLLSLRIYLANLIMFAILVTYYIILISLELNLTSFLKTINLILAIIAISFGLFSLIYYIVLLIKKNKIYKVEINHIVNSLFLIIIGVLFIIYK